MAATYPVDLSNELVTITAPDYSQGMLNSLKAVVADISTVATAHNSLDTKTQETLNDLKSKIDALSSLEKLDVDAVTGYIEKLRSLIDTVDSDLDITGMLDLLADELNSREVTVKKEVTFTSATGKALVDVTSLGFTAVTDYTVVVSADSVLTDGSLNPAVLRTRKQDASTIEITAQDTRSFFEVNPLYTDGGTTDANGGFPKSFNYSMIISYKKPTISKTINSVNGTTTTVGA